MRNAYTIKTTMSGLIVSQQRFAPEENGLATTVLEILHRPSRSAISLREIVRELEAHYDIIEVERCLLTLSNQGLVVPSYTSGYDLGFRERPTDLTV